MDEEQTYHTRTVGQAYAAYTTLRARHPGARITYAAIARLAGISRPVIYKDDPDWQEFRDVVENRKQSPTLEIATVEMREREAWERDIERLKDLAATCEAALKTNMAFSDEVYEALCGEALKYALLSAPLPAEQDKNVEVLKDLSVARHEINRLKTRIERLTAGKHTYDDPLPSHTPLVVTVGKTIPRNELTTDGLVETFMDTINEMDAYFALDDIERRPGIVYVLCGNFASGKSTWIRQHRPPMSGIALYIDGPHHTSRMRRDLVRRIRKLSPRCRIVCIRIIVNLDICLGRNGKPERARTGMVVPGSVIREIETVLGAQEVTVGEGFNSIEIVRGDDDLK